MTSAARWLQLACQSFYFSSWVHLVVNTISFVEIILLGHKVPMLKPFLASQMNAVNICLGLWLQPINQISWIFYQIMFRRQGAGMPFRHWVAKPGGSWDYHFRTWLPYEVSIRCVAPNSYRVWQIQVGSFVLLLSEADRFIGGLLTQILLKKVLAVFEFLKYFLLEAEVFRWDVSVEPNFWRCNLEGIKQILVLGLAFAPF